MRSILLILPLMLTACGTGDSDPGPGGVTQSEARELNEAAEMLDANAVMLNDKTDTGTDR